MSNFELGLQFRNPFPISFNCAFFSYNKSAAFREHTSQGISKINEKSDVYMSVNSCEV
jgi:hypothetical protein